MSCAKFGVDWTRNVDGVGKRQFCVFREKNYRRKWAWPMPKDAVDSSESVGIMFLTVGATREPPKMGQFDWFAISGYWAISHD